MNDAELRSFCNEMIGKFKMLSDLQKEMQYELIDTKFTEWELKKLIFALDVLRTIADRPQGEWIDGHGNHVPMTEHSAYCSHCGEWSEYLTDYCGNCGADMRGDNDGKDIQSEAEQ